jgi:hypothetical protein
MAEAYRTLWWDAARYRSGMQTRERESGRRTFATEAEAVAFVTAQNALERDRGYTGAADQWVVLGRRVGGPTQVG